MSGEGFIGWLAGLTRRERLLLALALAVALPLGVLFTVILPLAQERSAARAAVELARADALWVADQAQRNGALALVPDAEAASAPIGISGIEASLRAAELRQAVSELSDRGDGAVSIRFEAVRFTELAAWLSEVRPAWGYAITGFTFERGENPDIVAATFTLEAAR